MNKRAGAMEFLMTYGWFLLVFIGAISALAYFNVFSLKDANPSTCTIESGFLCRDFKATTTTIVFTVRNSHVRDLLAIGFGFKDGFDTCTGAALSDPADPAIPTTGTKTDQWWFNATSVNIPSGNDLARFTFTGCTNTGRATGYYSITYQDASEKIDHTSPGQINLKVES